MTANEIEELRDIAADHAARDPVYTPIFERLERELADARQREASVRRAKRLTAEPLI